jgi:hypothetical protein
MAAEIEATASDDGSVQIDDGWSQSKISCNIVGIDWMARSLVD